MLGLIYFAFTAKQNLPYIVKYSPTLYAKIKSVVWVFGFSILMGGFLICKGFYTVGKRGGTLLRNWKQLYRAYREVKKMNKKFKK